MIAIKTLGTCHDCHRGTLHVIDPEAEFLDGRCDGCGQVRSMHRSRVDPGVRRDRHRERAGFPAEFAGQPFDRDEHNRDAVAAVSDWLGRYQAWRGLRADDPDCAAEMPPGPAIWGSQGRGKTLLAVRLGGRLIDEADATVLFRTVRGLLRDLQDFHRDNGDRSRRGSLADQAFELALKVDVLILDDLGAQRPTDWRDEQLAELVDERHSRLLPIVLTTNAPPGAWSQFLDVRTVSRLRGMTFPVELDAGPDRRQQSHLRPVPEQ